MSIPPWGWGQRLLTQRTMGGKLDIGFHHIEDPIFYQQLMVLVHRHSFSSLGATIKIILLGFETITWFRSFVAHDL
jgi:hypothetical protein